MTTSKSCDSVGRPPADYTRLEPYLRSHRLPTDFAALLGRFSDALSIVASTTRALSTMQEDTLPNPDHDFSEDIFTLEHGLMALRAVYNELDVGIREIRT